MGWHKPSDASGWAGRSCTETFEESRQFVCLFVRLLLGLVCKIIIMNVYKGVIAAGRKLNASPPRRGDVRSRCLRKLLENPLRYPIISLSRIILSVADESLYFCSGYTSRGISACLGV
jgi:hypothetical protein